MDNKTVTLTGNNIGDIMKISSVPRREKVATIKSPPPCPSIVRQYNKSMIRDDLCDQYIAADRLDRRPKCRFYVLIFFYLMPLMDVASVNSFSFIV